MNQDIRRVVIAGGGTAGWIAAALLSHQFRGVLDVTLVESEEIGTIGVGESTIPPIRSLNRLLQIGEADFMRATAATFKLGISFEGWRDGSDRYIHSFGVNGKSAWACEFHHFWLRGQALGIQAELGDYCLELQAAKQRKFVHAPPQIEMNYAYHLDAGIYARFLRRYSEANGARRVEGKIRQVKQNAETGFVEALVLESGLEVAGDLFVDCTGFRGLLIEQALHAGYEDWSSWLICDSAVAVQTESTEPAVPYTRAIAHEAGWRWKIPLQHRVGNGLVYASPHLSDAAATEKILREVEGRTIIPPRVIKFRPGRRLKAWDKNVIAIGLAAGFVEPLESTSIHLIMTGVSRLIHMFPFGGISPSFIAQYNDDVRGEWEAVRDFIILHYKVTDREDTPFWRYVKHMDVPDQLARKIRMFRERAHAWRAENDVFQLDSWVQVMLGQGIQPAHYHHMTEGLSREDLARFLEGIRTTVARSVGGMPGHQEFLDHYCRASEEIWTMAAKR